MITFVLVNKKEVVFDTGNGVVMDYGTIEKFKKDEHFTKEEVEELKKNRWLEK